MRTRLSIDLRTERYPEGSIIDLVHGWRDRGGLPDLYKARQIIDELVRAEEGSDPTVQVLDEDTVALYRGLGS